MSTFKRYGQTWYTTKDEVESVKKPGEHVWFDKGLNAYHIKKTTKGIWAF